MSEEDKAYQQGYDRGYQRGLEDSSTLRDQFAINALTGLIACYDAQTTFDTKADAQQAYEYADAMLKAREDK